MGDVVQLSVYDELAEFITSKPDLEAIVSFQLSETAQSRLQELLSTNRSRRLTDNEEAELDEYVRLEHLVRKSKILAYEKLAAHL